VNSIIWEKKFLKLLDQTKLPLKIEYVKCQTYPEVVEAIKNMVVRGAPAIGVAAAYGMVLAAKEFASESKEVFMKNLCRAGELLKCSRPTAVNLFWAVDRMYQTAKSNQDKSTVELIIIIEEAAMNIHEEDIALNKRIGLFGVEVVPKNAVILTHCNAGALATAGYGTALGVVRATHEKDNLKRVFACETRPLLQGARLTAWELHQDKIPVTLITDSMAGYLMGQGTIDMVIVGADRIAKNGDVANKIGTYSLAILAKYHKIPFYVAAPYSTMDLNISSGNQIIVEERNCNEIRHIHGHKIIPDDILVYNPAFDITPNELITGIITDKGIVNAPYEEEIGRLFEKEVKA